MMMMMMMIRFAGPRMMSMQSKQASKQAASPYGIDAMA
jgi:hypothetical protein